MRGAEVSAFPPAGGRNRGGIVAGATEFRVTAPSSAPFAERSAPPRQTPLPHVRGVRPAWNTPRPHRMRPGNSPPRRPACRRITARPHRNSGNTPAPSDPGGTTSPRAGRATRREPAPDRAGRAASRPGSERPHGRDRGGQDGARARAGPAARRQAPLRASCGPGAAEAYVEGVFALPDELRAQLGDRLPEDAEEVVLARRVSAEGRTRAYLGGRSATAADLRDVGGALLSLLRPARAPQADARLGAAGDPGRLLRRRSRRRGARPSPPPTRTSASCAARSTSCRPAPARATASWTSWSGSCRRSRAPTRARRRRRR